MSTQNDQQSTTAVEKKQSTVDYPLTPPPPIVETRKSISNELKTKEDATSNMKGTLVRQVPKIFSRIAIAQSSVHHLSTFDIFL